MKNLSIIISASQYIYRMKGYGPPCLFKDNAGKTILEHQITTLKKCFPMAEIVVISGLWADKINNLRTNDFRIVENQLFEITNEVENIRLGLNNILNQNVLIIPGDLYFNTGTFTTVPNDSYLIYESRHQLVNIDIGMTIVDANATIISFDLTNKYTGIIYINEALFHRFKKICMDRSKNRLFLFEIINNLINNGNYIRAYEPKTMKIIKVNNVHQLQQYKEKILI